MRERGAPVEARAAEPLAADQAFENVIRSTLHVAEMSADELGHVHAHGEATKRRDEEEAAAIHDLFGSSGTPVTAAKSYMGNLGAGSGVVETVASLQAIAHNRLFPILNYQEPDPDCPVVAADPDQHPVGDSFINLNITPQGQASAILVQAVQD